MKLIINIPEEVKQKFDGDTKDDINFCFYDYNSIISKAIKNGTPLPNITDIVHKTIYSFFDIADDNSEEPINEKDKLLLEINKAICNNIKGVLENETDN